MSANGGKASVSPAFRVYFRLICDASVVSTEDLSNLSNTLVAESNDVDDVFVRFFRSRGSTFAPSYAACEILVQEVSYDPAVWKQKADKLFTYLDHCESRLHRARALAGVSAQLIINTNAHNADDRPVFCFDSTQVGLIASLGASVEFDGYLMFDEAV